MVVVSEIVGDGNIEFFIIVKNSCVVYVDYASSSAHDFTIRYPYMKITQGFSLTKTNIGSNLYPLPINLLNLIL